MLCFSFCGMCAVCLSLFAFSASFEYSVFDKVQFCIAISCPSALVLRSRSVVSSVIVAFPGDE